jgi:hypothetical protein
MSLQGSRESNPPPPPPTHTHTGLSRGWGRSGSFHSLAASLDMAMKQCGLGLVPNLMQICQKLSLENDLQDVAVRLGYY